MQATGTTRPTIGTRNPPTPARDFQTAAFLTATFLLVAPATVLLIIAGRARHTPVEEYDRAVHEALLAQLSPVSHSLERVNFDQPTQVVTWTGQEQAKNYKGKTTPEDKDTWVTVDHKLKSFCQDYVKSHGSDPSQLSRRLKQRLGLPQESKYDTFVEFKVDPKDISSFFRPCGEPSPTTDTCQPALALTPTQLKEYLNTTDPKKKQEMASRFWFLNQYYASFASARQYPWSSLGYTFDWAPKGEGEDFIRFGESEFVIPGGTPIQYLSATDTVEYCTPP